MTDSITQYRKFLEHNFDALRRTAPPLLNKYRNEAFDTLSHVQFPKKGDEGYEKISINEMFAPDYGINVNRHNIPTDVAASLRCDVPNVSTLLAVVSGDTFTPTESLVRNLPAGVEVMSLAQAAEKHTSTVEKYFNKIAPHDQNAAAALNTALCQDGVYVHVHPGIVLERPLQIVNIFSSTFPMMATRRVLVVVDEGAQASLLFCDHSQLTDVDYLSNQVIEVSVGRNASLSICDMEESSLKTRRMSQMYVLQQADSRFDAASISLLSGTTRNNFTVRHAGTGCETRLWGMAIGSDTTVVDNATLLTHEYPACHSDQTFKYVLDGASQGAFEGTIKVLEGATHTEAYQSNRNLLASGEACMHSMPQLEIYCDDVKCSHGATTGQLDQNALFYMRSRGIPEDQARMMLTQAFMADIINAIPVESLRQRLHHLVEKRLIGAHALCADCSGLIQ